MKITAELSAALAGRYVVEREIGHGGMAVVYLARDTKHDRLVAVKVLKPELAASLGSERFLSEIKTTATLQHPNLLPLFDSGEAGGLLYYVMPYLDGESLRARLEREQQLPVEDAVQIATGIAHALSYAHAHGVIHRHLKPENVLLQHGQPVVLDFGIALAVRNAAEGRKTHTGISVGTPQYMSPEQAAGEKVIDARADIYALGTLTYEMLAGEPPHTGPSAQAIIARVMSGDVRPVTTVRPSVPAHVASAVQRALALVPADRFSTAAEFARALDAPPTVSLAGAAPAVTPGVDGLSVHRRRYRTAVATASGLAVLATAAAAWAWLRPVPPPRPMRFDLTVGPAPLAGNDVSISPDGTMLTYSGTIAGGSTAIFVRRLTGEPDFRMLAGTETGTHPAFSPDNQWIVFHRGRDGVLVKVSVAGGGQTTIISDPNAFNPHWGTPGEVVYSGPPGVFIVPASGGTPKQLRGVGGRRPFLLPDGSGVLGNVGDRAVLYDLRTDSVIRLMPNARNPVYTASGHVIYDDAQGGLSAVPFDLERHRVTGPPVRVLDRVASSVNTRAFSVSNTGTLVQHEGAETGAGNDTRLVIRGFDGRADTLPLQGGRRLFPRFSPDGRLVAYSLRSGSGTTDIYTYDLVAGTNTQLTFGGNNQFPVWSPDGTRILYAAESLGTGTLRVKSADNSGPERVLVTEAAGNVSPNAWPRDDLILYTVGAGPGAPRTNPANRGGDLMTLSLEPGAKPRPYLAAPWAEFDVALSPDGRHAAFTSRESSTPDIWLREFPTPMGKWKVSTRNGQFARWSPDGNYIYYLNSVTTIDSIFRVRVDRSPTVVVHAPELVMTVDLVASAPWDIHPDGKRLILDVPDSPLTAASSQASPSRFVVILNWFTELRQLIAARTP